MPTDIAEKMIALKRKQAKYVSLYPPTPPNSFPLLLPLVCFSSDIIVAFLAMSESRTVQNVRPLSLYKVLRHRLADRSTPPDSHHLRSL